MRNAIIVLLASLFILACGKAKDEKGAKLAELCVEATKQLENAGNADGETFMLMLQNALQACSGGCDAKDDASCKSLEAHLGKICKVSASVCESLCADATSGSLKKYSCQAAGK